MENKKTIFGIASYDRVGRQHTLNYLRSLGYEKQEIIISTQSQEDYRLYKEKHGDDAVIIYREGYNVSDNKNNILDFFNDNYNGETYRLIICSDKIREIMYLSKEDCKLVGIRQRKLLDAVIGKMFRISSYCGCAFFGCYSTGNAYFMKHTISINQQILGCFMGMLRTDIKFDNSFPLKEDFEISMRAISKGYRVARFNEFALKETLHTKGGCYKFWNADGDIVNFEVTQRLLYMYPSLLKEHSTRPNEVRFIGPSSTIKKSIIQ